MEMHFIFIHSEPKSQSCHCNGTFFSYKYDISFIRKKGKVMLVKSREKSIKQSSDEGIPQDEINKTGKKRFQVQHSRFKRQLT